jgi:hypothetical protein
MKIAVSGMKGSGKDYCVDIITSLYKAQVLSFSDHLKSICHGIFPWLEIDYPPDCKEKIVFYSHVSEKHYTPRDIWTMMNIVVEIDPDILVRKVEREIQCARISETAQHLIIKDLRPHNPSELYCCERNNFDILYITCDNQPEITHKSEEGYNRILDRAKWVFHNGKNGPEEFVEFLEKRVMLNV